MGLIEIGSYHNPMREDVKLKVLQELLKVGLAAEVQCVTPNT